MILAAAALLIQVENTTLVLQNVSIVEPERARIVEKQTVICRGDQIVSVGPSAKATVPAGATIVDGTGKFVMPGLWDMHIHMLEKKSLPLFTANGVTGTRIMFGSPVHLSWKKEADGGSIVGPRFILGSPIVDGPKPIWAGSYGVKNAEEGREVVRKIKSEGYDFVKVYSLLPRDAYMAIADECKKLGIPFAGHVPYSVSIQEAARAGQRTAEHVLNISLDCSEHEAGFRAQIAGAAPDGREAVGKEFQKVGHEMTASFDPQKLDALLSELARLKMWQCPTLVVLRSMANVDEIAKAPQDPRMKYIPLLLKMTWDPTKDSRLSNRTPADWQAAKKTFEGTRAVVASMHRKGVPILAGSDCLNPYVFPGFSLHEELELLVQTGMTPAQALATATINPAKFLGIEKQAGSVATGKRADLVLLSANPLQNIKNTTAIEAVVQRGRLFNRSKLDELLTSAEY